MSSKAFSRGGEQLAHLSENIVASLYSSSNFARRLQVRLTRFALVIRLRLLGSVGETPWNQRYPPPSHSRKLSPPQVFGSVFSLLWAVSLRKNGYQVFLLATLPPQGGANRRLGRQNDSGFKSRLLKSNKATQPIRLNCLIWSE